MYAHAYALRKAYKLRTCGMPLLVGVATAILERLLGGLTTSTGECWPTRLPCWQGCGGRGNPAEVGAHILSTGNNVPCSRQWRMQTLLVTVSTFSHPLDRKTSSLTG